MSLCWVAKSNRHQIQIAVMSPSHEMSTKKYDLSVLRKVERPEVKRPEVNGFIKS
jgi:hypothetical protein